MSELEKDAYLTYAVQAGDYVVTQYVTTEGKIYGILLDENCEKLAYLPGVRDVVGEELLFDYGNGTIYKTPIYELDELKEFAGGNGFTEENGSEKEKQQTE